ncbi:YjfA family protein [Streptomyces sp. NBC_00201]|uniref:DUF2690 domain-containing protein n=1 Tax=unclassified Streptomyces TaxID=2593676 RepID=UPI0022540D65|nr:MULTISPECIES: DUF2690 domain-containing protein [unclassified Streptomyces]MCX5055514.1 YjfA family protein [Streptomyces sp. NBC_00452]MCX5247640.1 YjfA family protein [Streptomyces sp. NBC_00201]MCX5286578.1 YjfA family protein [Streptomyces sp. NBC_00183]
MPSLPRRLGTSGAVLALAVSGLLFGTASPASAATSCLGPGCNGLNPANTVCANDARTIDTTWSGVELRYSPTCRAAWARRVGGINGATDTIWAENSKGRTYSVDIPSNASGTYYTAMVDDKDLWSRACDNLGDDGGYNCTAKY